MLELLVVGVLVLGSVAYLAKCVWREASSGSCGCGECGSGCSAASDGERPIPVCGSCPLNPREP